MLTDHSRIAAKLSELTPRLQPGATKTSQDISASSRPKWCAAPSSQAEISMRGTLHQSRSRI